MAAPTTLGDVHVLLWRGINVGAHRRIPKVDLIRWAEQAGGTDVRTVQASGNVILTLPAGADPAAVAASVAAAARAGRRSPCMLPSRPTDFLRIDQIAVVAASPRATVWPRRPDPPAAPSFSAASTRAIAGPIFGQLSAPDCLILAM